MIDGVCTICCVAAEIFHKWKTIWFNQVQGLYIFLNHFIYQLITFTFVWLPTQQQLQTKVRKPKSHVILYQPRHATLYPLPFWV